MISGRRWEAVLNSLQVATPEVAAATEGMPPLTASGKRKAAEALMPSEPAAASDTEVGTEADTEVYSTDDTEHATVLDTEVNSPDHSSGDDFD